MLSTQSEQKPVEKYDDIGLTIAVYFTLHKNCFVQSALMTNSKLVQLNNCLVLFGAGHTT